MDDTFEVTLSRHEKYQFDADFHDGHGTRLRMDEPEPLGDGVGPNAARVLAAAIGNCTGTIVRNERGRMRLGALKVHISPNVGSVPPEKIQRCVDIFEDFCLVTATVRDGLNVQVEVGTTVGTRLDRTEAP